jgi:hypothetical protein
VRTQIDDLRERASLQWSAAVRRDHRFLSSASRSAFSKKVAQESKPIQQLRFSITMIRDQEVASSEIM